MSEHRAGFVTIIGRPNVGKSTLLNAFLGQKVAIVTPKPQTTRDRIAGICHRPDGQIVFLDTPGVHRGEKALNRHMSLVALGTVADADAVLFVIDASRTQGVPTKEDEALLRKLIQSGKPIVCALNKVDLIEKLSLLPLLAVLGERGCFQALVPVSAVKGIGFEAVLSELQALMPVGPALYPEDELTDRPVRFLCGELLREQLTLSLGQELPYSVAVEITGFKQRPDRPLVDIDATIHVERASQKGIVLGKGGERIKEISSTARQEMETLLQQQVFLRIHVRVESRWTTSERAMRKLGYDNKSK